MNSAGGSFRASGWLAVTWVLVAGVSCSTQTENRGSSEASTRDGGTSGAGGTKDTVFAGAGGSPAAAASGGQDAAAISPPLVSCQTDAGGRISSSDAGAASADAACAPPPSLCADDHTLAYFADGRCVDGRCQWKVELLNCPVGCGTSGCFENRTR